MAAALILEGIAEPERAEDCAKALRKINLSDGEHAAALMMAHSIASKLISLGEDASAKGFEA